MWNKFKPKLIDYGSRVIAYTLVVFTIALLIIVPITVICSCVKLIMIMFGV